MIEREQQIRAARRILTDGQLTAFLRAAEKMSDVFAVKLICRELAEETRLDEIFYTGSDYGYQLSIEQTSAATFRIAFGCQVEYTAGDGGEWDVSFIGDQVDSISITGRWIS
jgi:hypothetical protein